MPGRYDAATTITRADLIKSGAIVDRPPNWRRFWVLGSQLTADELDRRGYHAAADAKRNIYVEYFESGFIHHMRG